MSHLDLNLMFQGAGIDQMSKTSAVSIKKTEQDL